MATHALHCRRPTLGDDAPEVHAGQPSAHGRAARDGLAAGDRGAAARPWRPACEDHRCDAVGRRSSVARGVRRKSACHRAFTAADGVRAFYRLYAARFGKPRWGEKTPNYGVHMEACRMLGIKGGRRKWFHIGDPGCYTRDGTAQKETRTPHDQGGRASLPRRAWQDTGGRS